MRAIYLEKKVSSAEKFNKIEQELDALKEKVNKKLSDMSDKLVEQEKKSHQKRKKRK